MSEHRKRLEKDLRASAERWVPRATDPWHSIRERLTAEQETGERTVGGQVDGNHAETVPRRRPWSSQLWPGTPLGYFLAALSVLIVGVGVYAASGLVGDLARSGMPGTGAANTGETTDLGQVDGSPGVVDDLFRQYVPGAGGEELHETKTAGGVKVTLVRAYADADSVVVGYTVEDLQGGRRVGAYPAELQPEYSPSLRLTDESGNEFSLVDYGRGVSPGPNILEGPQANVAVFEAGGRIEPDSEHGFRLGIRILKVPVTSPVQAEETQAEETPEARRVGEPFVIGFETPVQPAPVVDVDRTATASGTTLTLERVTDSPGQPEAVLCLESRDGVRGWFPVGEDVGSVAPTPVAGEGDCLQVMLNHPLDGPSSVTVPQIEKDGEVIRGPWRFDFEMPGS